MARTCRTRCPGRWRVALGLTGLVASLLMPVGAWAGAPVADSGLGVYLDLEALFLDRQNPGSDTLWRFNAPPRDEVLNADGFTFGTQYGGRGRIGLAQGLFGVEVGGFWVATWFDRESFGNVAGLLEVDTDPVTTFTLGASGTEEARYDSDLHGADANLVLLPLPGIALLAGVRWIDLHEKVRFEATSPFFAEVDTWEVGNRLIGPQLGVRADLVDLAGFGESRLSLSTEVKTAVMFDDIHVVYDTALNLAGPPPGPYAWGDDDHDEVGASVEGNVRLGFEVVKGVVLHVGYQILWLQDVATAVGQIGGTASFNPGGEIEVKTRTDNVFFQGGTVGITIAIP